MARLLNRNSIETALIKAFGLWAKEDINDKFFSEQFIDRQWPYPGPPTIRKAGGIADNPRDIYDTGKLFKSGQNSFTLKSGPNLTSAGWYWDATNASGEEYAFYVHEGKGPHARVPRKWTDDLVIPAKFAQSDAIKDLSARISIEFAGLHGN